MVRPGPARPRRVPHRPSAFSPVVRFAARIGCRLRCALAAHRPGARSHPARPARVARRGAIVRLAVRRGPTVRRIAAVRLTGRRGPTRARRDLLARAAVLTAALRSGSRRPRRTRRRGRSWAPGRRPGLPLPPRVPARRSTGAADAAARSYAPFDPCCRSAGSGPVRPEPVQVAFPRLMCAPVPGGRLANPGPPVNPRADGRGSTRLGPPRLPWASCRTRATLAGPAERALNPVLDMAPGPLLPGLGLVTGVKNAND